MDSMSEQRACLDQLSLDVSQRMSFLDSSPILNPVQLPADPVCEAPPHVQAQCGCCLNARVKKGEEEDPTWSLLCSGKHNPEATSHDADHCWKLHPELRPPQSSKTFGPTSTQTPTTQLVEVDDGHESEISIFLTKEASKPMVLDSGATHHLINNPEMFRPTAESNIKIATGGHSNFLNAAAVGTATLINHLGDWLNLENKIFQSLKPRTKGAVILIDKNYQLLGSLKKNLLEIHSSHFEVIKSHSSCYQSSPDSPNWHAHLSHPSRQFQAMMVPKSEIS
ncbi:hypothetical protein VP01_3743g1 [Puccinia sorghi]|uniref:Uncharacterized protein n=1 Tax=Puccinia sorghi TaxID=27349 RepID=A0A0L6UUQ6_9BASI|nr:hypothetical protein VP01_3743g1 [Puccinia sorghi]